IKSISIATHRPSPSVYANSTGICGYGTRVARAHPPLGSVDEMEVRAMRQQVSVISALVVMLAVAAVEHVAYAAPGQAPPPAPAPTPHLSPPARACAAAGGRLLLDRMPVVGDPRLEPIPNFPIRLVNVSVLGSRQGVLQSEVLTMRFLPRVNGQNMSDGDKHSD